MSYLKNSFKYYFKNFFRVALLLLPVSFLIGFFMNIYSPISFLKQFSLGMFSSFKDVMSFYFNSFKGLGSLYVILTFIALIVMLSFVAGAINYHMRSGKFSFKEGFKQGISYLLPIFVIALILTGILALFNFVGPLIMLFLHSSFGGLANNPSSLIVIIGICLFALFFVIYTILSLIFILSINSIVMNGYNLKNALSRSVNLLDNKLIKLLLVLIAPFLIVLPCVLFIQNSLILKIVSSVLIFIQISSYMILIFNFYFEVNNMERNDFNKTTYYYKKK